MPFIELLLIALSMAMDAFAVSLGAGTTGLTEGPRPRFRLSFHFGLFQFLMPVIGWLAGTTIERYIQSFDHWIAFGLLAFVGGRMIWSGFHPEDEQKQDTDLSRGWTLVLLSIAVSIDALAVGLSLGLMGISIWYPAIVIGVVTSLLSLAGLFIGDRLGKKFGSAMEVIGGLVLIGIGIRIVVIHLLVERLSCHPDPPGFNLLPAGKIPFAQRHAQFRLAVQVELDQGVLDVRLDRFLRHPQAGGDLAVGVAQARQGTRLLLARREGLPPAPQGVGCFPLCQGAHQQVSLQLARWSLLLHRHVLQRQVQVLIQLKQPVPRPVSPSQEEKHTFHEFHQPHYTEHVF